VGGGGHGSAGTAGWNAPSEFAVPDCWLPALLQGQV
jgi:hypothetical protein